MKIVFKVDDVAAARDELMRRGAVMEAIVRPDPSFAYCDGTDPAGNRFQISSR
jgi:hypothetical protein